MRADNYRSNIVVALSSTKKEKWCSNTVVILTQKITMMYRMSADYYTTGDGRRRLQFPQPAAHQDQKQAKKPPYQAMKLKGRPLQHGWKVFPVRDRGYCTDPQKLFIWNYHRRIRSNTPGFCKSVCGGDFLFQARYNEGKHLSETGCKKGRRRLVEDLSSDGGYQI